MPRISPFVLALTLATPLAAQELPGPRPFDAQHGDCAAFAMDISREAALWHAAQSQPVTASAEAGSAPVMPAQTLLDVTLVPQGDIRFSVTPEQDRGAPDRFGGHLAVTIPSAGLWRVAASNGLWFDAVVGADRVPTAAFEMQTGCQAPFKVVVFDLPAGTVSLQFNGSPSQNVSLTVLPWSPR